QDTDGPERPAIALENTRQGQVRREACAVARGRGHASTPGPPSAQCLLELWSDAPAIVLVQDVEATQRSAGNLVAQPPPPGLIQGHDPAIWVAGEDAVLHALDNRCQQALGATK